MMKATNFALCAVLIGCAAGPALAAGATPTGAEGPIHHDIFITLKNRSEAAIDRQLALGAKYLTDHPGELSFSSGVLAQGLTRHQQVPYLHNDDETTVAFHIVFKDATAHDAYQVADRHVKHFIPESNPNWKAVRVFDTSERPLAGAAATQSPAR